MKEVIAEALEIITGQTFGENPDEWQEWWNSVSDVYTPQATIRNFMHAAFQLDSNKAMRYVAPDSHDYDDIKAIFENPEHPFYTIQKSGLNSTH